MILKSLTLINYRKFKDALIEFPDGVTGIIGLNGVGKSTIFEAVAWVLYGTVAARTSSDQIKRNGAKDIDTCRVELDFIFEGDKYRIVREMTGKNLTPSASVIVNSKIIATGAGTVSRFIQKKLGMDFKAFYTSIFAKQKELNALSDMNASERRPLILKMLGIDSLDDVIKEINNDRKTKDLIVKKLYINIQDNLGKNKIDKYKEEIKNLESLKEETNFSIKQIEGQINIVKKDLLILEKKYSSIKNEYEKFNLRNEHLIERKTLFENKNKLIQEIKLLKNKIHDRKTNINKYKLKLKNFDNVTIEYNKIEARTNEIEKIKLKNVKNIEQRKVLLKNIEIEIKDINLKRLEIEKAGPDADCPTCERILGNQYSKLLDKYDKQIIINEKEKLLLIKNIKFNENEYNIIYRENQALEKREKYLQNQQKEKEKIETTISNISEEITYEIKELKNKENQLINLNDIDFDLKEYTKIKQDVKKLYEKNQSVLKIIDIKKDNFSNMKLNLEKKQGKKNLIVNEIKNINDKINQIKQIKKRINKEKNHVQNLKMLSEMMSLFRTHLISRIRPSLSSNASDFFINLTEGKYQEIEVNEQYDIMIYDGGIPYNISRFSGGEEDLANLCLRLAISEIITERAGGLFNFIILDEIFGSQDIIRQKRIMKALNGLSSKYRQILLITHVEDIKNHVENVVYVNENESGVSTIKIE